MRCSPTINVDRLKPFVTRVDAPPPPGPVTDAGQEGEHGVELLLNRRTIRGVTRYLVRWRGHASPEDQWLRKEELTHCPERVAEYNAAASRRRSALRAERAAAAAPRPRLPEGPATPVGPHAPVGFRLARPDEVLAGAALVGARVLYWWPTEGWVPGAVTRRSRSPGFSHVVGYGRNSALGAAMVTSLLDAASHGPRGRWILLLRDVLG